MILNQTSQIKASLQLFLRLIQIVNQSIFIENEISMIPILIQSLLHHIPFLFYLKDSVIINLILLRLLFQRFLRRYNLMQLKAYILKFFIIRDIFFTCLHLILFGVHGYGYVHYLIFVQYVKMQYQIITQQIDVIVIGDRRYELINFMLEKDFQLEDQHKKRTTCNYMELLSQMINQNTIVKQPNKWIPAPKYNGISKFTKIILTESFWLHIHFFIHDNKLFDPFIFDSNKGNISICIIAATQTIDLTGTKNYLHQNVQQSTLNHAYNQPGFQTQSIIFKPENLIQAKIYCMIHEIEVKGFSSVLALKITDQKKIIEQSSNLRLTVNQISRWIVDRHFQNKHKIKIRQQLGDQIQKYEQKNEKGYCQIM